MLTQTVPRQYFHTNSLRSFIEHLLVLMSILASGSLYYTSYSNPFLLLYFSICMGALLLLKKFNLSKYYFLYALISICFLLLHPTLLGNLDIPNIYFGYSIRIACFLIVVSILGHKKFFLETLNCEGNSLREFQTFWMWDHTGLVFDCHDNSINYRLSSHRKK